MKKYTAASILLSLITSAPALAQGINNSTDVPRSIWGNGIILIFGIIVISIYFIPSFVAGYREITKKPAVWVVNIFFGWTLIGWVIALVMAFSFEKQADYNIRMAAAAKIASSS